MSLFKINEEFEKLFILIINCGLLGDTICHGE
jgi:hypothetical protein